MRKILYISGTRADFGLLESTLKLIQKSGVLEICVCVTGMHLDNNYGYTINEVEATGLRVCGKIPVNLSETDGASMARAIAAILVGVVEVIQAENPDIVMLLGDRGEMLAGAIAAIHLNTPIVHLHGGELSGTIDEPVRHAITKLSHYHFTSTDGARQRVIRMGEVPENVFVTGAPGLDGLKDIASIDRKSLCNKYQLNPDIPIALVVFHPVVQEVGNGEIYVNQLMQAVLQDVKCQAIVLLPNADAGAAEIRECLESYSCAESRILVHLPRLEFLSWLAAADVMVGNSSSGIIEAASLGTPVINIGNRQNRRERSNNVIDVEVSREAIAQGIRCALSMTGPYTNVYGDGHAGERIVQLLETISLDKKVMMKCNAY
jgi:GDP/UDP-N,N'-diacetylbacillosamine 2-epimerase (hydrolysing)